MDELSVSCVDTDMSDTASAGVGEKDDVPGLQVVLAHEVALGVQCFGSAVWRITKLLKNIIYQSGAIEAGRGGSAVYIRSPDIFRGLIRYGLSGDRCIISGRPPVASGVVGAASCGSIGNVVSDRGRTGCGSKALAVSEELRFVGGSFVFVRILCQFQIIAAHVANGIAVDDLIPSLVQSDYVAKSAFRSTVDHSVCSTGTAADIHPVGSYFSVTELSILLCQNIKVISVHVTFLEIVDHMIPIAGSADDYDTFLVGCDIEVEDSILFREVTIGKDAEVENCILFNDAVIGEGAELKYVILDKNVTVTPGAKLIGTKKSPIIVKRGETV